MIFLKRSSIGFLVTSIAFYFFGSLLTLYISIPIIQSYFQAFDYFLFAYSLTVLATSPLLLFFAILLYPVCTYLVNVLMQFSFLMRTSIRLLVKSSSYLFVGLQLSEFLAFRGSSVGELNDNLLESFLGYKFLILLFFLIALFSARSNDNNLPVQTLSVSSRMFLLSTLSLLSLKRNLFLLGLFCIVDHIFSVSDNLNLNRFLIKLKSLYLPLKPLKLLLFTVLLPFVFIILFGLVMSLRLGGDGNEASDLINYFRAGLSSITFYMAMPFLNTIEAIDHYFRTCDLTFLLVNLLPNRFSFTTCAPPVFVSGIGYGFNGSLILSTLPSALISIILTAFFLASYAAPGCIKFLRPVSIYYFVNSFQYSLFLNLPFVLSPLVAAILVCVAKSPGSRDRLGLPRFPLSQES